MSYYKPYILFSKPSAPTPEEEIDAIADFFLIGDDAIVDGSNILTSWKERISGNNVNIVGSSIVTVPNHTDGHRAVKLSRNNKCFTVPHLDVKSFYAVYKRFRTADNGLSYFFRTNYSDVNTGISGTLEFNDGSNATTVGLIQDDYTFYGYNASEIAMTTGTGYLLIDHFRTVSTYTANGVARSHGAIENDPDPSTATLTSIGGNLNGSNALNAEILEIICFTTEATTDEHNTVLDYLNTKYPSI